MSYADWSNMEQLRFEAGQHAAEVARLREALRRIVRCDFPTTGLDGAIAVAREALKVPLDDLPPRAKQVVDEVMAHVEGSGPGSESR